jgi:hypothetical protein
MTINKAIAATLVATVMFLLLDSLATPGPLAANKGRTYTPVGMVALGDGKHTVAWFLDSASGTVVYCQDHGSTAGRPECVEGSLPK